MKTIRKKAKLEFLDVMLDEIDQYLMEIGLPKKYRLETQLIAEELFTNTATYSYDTDSEDNYCQFEFAPQEDELLIRITDEGRPFDPTAAPLPDVSAPYQTRLSHGLGIFIVRHYITRMNYRYTERKNILSLYRAFPS